ncbi:MAG: 5-formyltetrahydrofolate cyclo-ligase [Solobacterium sp.]|nr:5-formyltetrahydrofolate cyclo-ligase [Solobacterium sp.]
MDKITARRTGRLRRSLLDEGQRREMSLCIEAKLKEIVHDCSTVCCYVSLSEEVHTHELITWMLANGIHVIVPKTCGTTLEFYEIHSLDDLSEGVYGVLEPISGEAVAIEACDLVIVPLCAFDEACHRVGYGKGYYDSVLKRAKHTLGIAFEVQKMSIIETDPWDVALDEILTEERVYRTV